MKVLELFAGTHSVGKVAKELGHQVLSLDLKNADINCDILKWDFSQYKVGEFDYIHASPECWSFCPLRKTFYGKPLKIHNPNWKEERNVLFNENLYFQDQLLYGVPLLEKTLEIIDYFKPKYFTIENPAGGDMKNYINDISFTDINYCKYGFPYKKPTRIWNNFEFVGEKCENNCNFIYNKVHLQTIGKAALRNKTKHITSVEGIKGGGQDKKERYRIPPLLIHAWFEKMREKEDKYKK